MRKFIWFLGLCLSLVIILPIAACFFFDLNTYKPQLSALLVEKTGLPLTIEGPMRLQLFPTIGLHVSDISLKQPNAFGGDPFLHIDTLRASMPLATLFQAQWNIDNVHLEGLHLHVIKPKNASSNVDYYWSLYKKRTTATTPRATLAPTDKKTPRFSFAKKIRLNVQNIQCTKAFVQYDQLPEQKTLLLNNLHIMSTKNASRYALNAEISVGEHKLLQQIPLATWVTISPTQWVFEDIKANLLDGKLHAKATYSPQQRTPLTLEGKLEAFDVSPLFAKPQKPSLITGQGNITFALTHTKEGLNGTAKVHIHQGHLHGVDIPYYLDFASALWKKSHARKTNTKQTSFETLNATLYFRNNILSNNDLVFTASNIKTLSNAQIS